MVSKELHVISNNVEVSAISVKDAHEKEEGLKVTNKNHTFNKIL